MAVVFALQRLSGNAVFSSRDASGGGAVSHTYAPSGGIVLSGAAVISHGSGSGTAFAYLSSGGIVLSGAAAINGPAIIYTMAPAGARRYSLRQQSSNFPRAQ